MALKEAAVSAALLLAEAGSLDLVYPFELSMISGARYQRVATYSVRNPVWSCCGSAIRASPKSQIYRTRRQISTCTRVRSASKDLLTNQPPALLCNTWPSAVTLRSQVVFNSRLLGLRSRCSTLAEWMYLSPRSIW